MSDAYRQSALLLHGIEEGDRQWILAQLVEEQRSQLTSHLTELNQMGIPADRSLSENLLSGVANKSTINDEKTGHLLRNADADVVLRLLNDEPIWLIAAVLSLEAWPWREAIYVGLDASKRDRVKHALREALPSKLRLALVSQLEERLPSVERDLENRFEESGLTRFTQKIKQVIRTWL